MKINFGSLFLIATLTIVSLLPAFGQATPTNSSSSITVVTDKSSYFDGEQMTISGTVSAQLNVPISIVIRDPSQNIVWIGQITANTDNTYSTQVIVGGRLWTVASTYEVDVTYGNTHNTAKTTFVFTGHAPIFPIVIQGQTYNATYSITNGKILGITPNVDTKSLKITIQPSGNGSLSITLPRSLIDAKNGTQDSQFIVQENSTTTTFKEIKSDTYRTLTISFASNTNEMTIIGTQILPEFGSVALIVLAISMMILVLYTRARFNFRISSS